MFHREMLITALTVCLTANAFADPVNVGSAQYADKATITVDSKPVNLVLTGAAMRQKMFVNVYAIASYVQAGTSVRNAEGLASANVAKQLRLVMQRDVAGRDLAEAFRIAIRQNYPEPAYKAEVDTLVRMLHEGMAHKGDEVLLTNVPGVGLQVNVTGKAPFMIKNAGFSKAVWDIYLGPANVGESVKKGLVSRL